MSTTPSAPDALIVSGDDRVQKILAQEDAVVVPAYAFFLDGFVKDTFTEYANPSIYRPPSVCSARLVSTLRDMYQFKETGTYYFGFTMYADAGYDEPVEVWIGHEQVALARHPDPDNRVHLFVAPKPIGFQGGELKRLITGKTDGPCRIENVVLLKKRPRPTPPELTVLSPHVDVRHDNGKACAYITWMTSRPASGRLRWGSGKRLSRTVEMAGPLANHEVVLEGLDLNKSYRFELDLTGRVEGLKAAYAGVFKTDLTAPSSRVKKGRVPIRLRRPGNGLWPVSVGVPFPKGALGSEDEIRLVDKRGAEVGLQARSLARWEDGSVRWALLDFQADGKHEYTAEYGSEVSRSVPGDRLEVSESETSVVVTTGPLRVEFPKGRVVFPGVVWVKRTDGSYRKLSGPSAGVRLTGADGSVYGSGKPEAVVVEEAGSERVCVRVEAVHRLRSRSLFHSILRVHLFRGNGAIRVLHTFENDRVEEMFTCIRELSLRSDFKVGGALQGRVGRRRVEGLKAGGVVLHQGLDNRYVVRRGGAEIARGRRAEGSVALRGDRGGVSLVVRDFWQNYPKGVAVDEKGITVGICPALDEADYPRGGELEDRLYYYLLDGVYKFKAGVSRTHEMWFHIRSKGDAPEGFAASVQRPPLYGMSLAAFNKSRALTRLPEKEKSPFPPYETWVETVRGVYAEDREKSRAYGMLNYGDWFGERVYNWGNMEYDTPWCFLQEYLRGGHSDFYTWAEEAARHLVDVDTVHHTDEPDNLGSQYIHSVGHVGNYYPDGYRERAIFAGRWSVSHTWVEGLFLYHLLTGDARALESAMQTSNLLVGNMLNDYDFTNCRNCGWHLIHLAAAYKATGRRVYLNAARTIVDRVLERQKPSGGWERLMVPGHCFCYPLRHMGNAGFMVGVLMAGLRRFYEATGEKRVRDAIVHAATFCIDDMWVPENRAFRYTSCPKSSVGRSADMAILKGIAFAYDVSGNERLREVLFEGVRSAMAQRETRAHRGVGKSIGMPMRGAYQVLVDLPERSV